MILRGKLDPCKFPARIPSPRPYEILEMGGGDGDREVIPASAVTYGHPSSQEMQDGTKVKIVLN